MKLPKQIQLIITEGKHASSHKFAFLRAGKGDGGSKTTYVDSV